MKVKMFPLLALSGLLMLGSFTGCKKKEGCTDPASTNFDPEAEVDNGTCVYPPSGPVTVSGEITANTTWTRDKQYLLSGFVYVRSGAILTIEAGTIIRGDKATKGTLIVERGAKIIADGTAAQPIVFTSNQAAGARDYGDWGGIIICGNAPVNLPGGSGVVEGGTNASYGGNNAADNSGILRYVRIEYPGIPFQPNQEINGLTLGGVGNGTVIENVMVSYSGDDAYEMFGGTVNLKNVIAFRTWDDDFDTDNGYTGNVQFAFALRDPNVADQSGSNGFESDNDGQGTTATPFTAPVFSNVTVLGPKADTGTAANAQFKRAAHLRRNTKLAVFNSVFAGYPTGLYIDGSGAEANATADELQFRHNVISGCATPLAVAAGSTFDITTWYNTAAWTNALYTVNSDLQLNASAFNLSAPGVLPQASSPLLSGADFTEPKLSGSFFTQVTYRGAFGSSNWTSGWANWTPQTTEY